MVIILKEDNVYLYQSLDKPQSDKEDLMDINIKLEHELYDWKVESKEDVALQKVDYNLTLKVCFESPLMNDVGINNKHN